MPFRQNDRGEREGFVVDKHGKEIKPKDTVTFLGKQYKVQQTRLGAVPVIDETQDAETVLLVGGAVDQLVRAADVELVVT